MIESSFKIPTSLYSKKGVTDFEEVINKFITEHKELAIKDLVRIDPGNIEGDLLIQPEVLASISIVHAAAERDRATAKQVVGECYAELYKTYKETLTDGSKRATVEDIKNAVLMDESYKNFQKEMYRCDFFVDVIKGIKSAVETKSRLIRDMYNGDVGRREKIETNN